MKLTADLIKNSPTYLNPIKDRELDLSNNHITLIENLGATRDLNDALNLCANSIRVLGNFPILTRLKSLYLSNNRIAAIDHRVPAQLPNLVSLVLTANNIEELKVLEPLRELGSLEYLSLLNNPVMSKPHARLWCIWRFPSVRVLNFEKVLQNERIEAKKLFEVAADGSLSALALDTLTIEAPAVDNTFEPGEGLDQHESDDKMNVDSASASQTITDIKAKIRDEMSQIQAMEEFI
ncbi:U2 snRNP complex subunit [Coemansia sp. RSA 1813]|nr:U2 snRNP complex subunit [Coemansia sp. RSA 1843]KAJ2091422.1 U2 snRNP complex subunit [Coemansia sp. RSA 986]KAJ2210555.1 U2 snRNP complex subunit [Coemansia sp. RSA 487]KAJ2569587.1 U2 snRNP complex subunit [Coemansia sp. RSA 1813]